METLEGVTIFNNKITPIYQVTCPECNYDRLDLVLNKYCCARCGNLFETTKLEEEL